LEEWRRILFAMSNHIYKKIELVGSSPDNIEDAVKNALSKASKSLRNIRWFEIVETRGHVEDGRIGHWQVRRLDQLASLPQSGRGRAANR
jgi:flavin-binding protein dodecin